MSSRKEKVAIYARAATSDHEAVRSLEAQEAACDELAVSEGYPGGAECVHRDVGSSGVTLDRPQLAKLRRMAAAGELSTLFVYSVDRLSRGLTDLLVLLREFNEHGVDVHFVQDSLDSTPEGDLVKFVLGYAGQRERAQFPERSL